jgi:hypothetical protein
VSRQKISAQVRAHKIDSGGHTFPLSEAVPPGIDPVFRFVSPRRSRKLMRRGVTITRLPDGKRFWVWERGVQV